MKREFTYFFKLITVEFMYSMTALFWTHSKE